MSIFSTISCQLLSQTLELAKNTPSNIPLTLVSSTETTSIQPSPTPPINELETNIPTLTATSEPTQQTIVSSTLIPSLTAIAPTYFATSFVLTSPTSIQTGPKIYKITIHNNYYFPLQVYIDEKFIMTIPGRKYMWFRGVLEGLHIVLLCQWQGHCTKKIISFDEDKELWTGP